MLIPLLLGGLGLGIGIAVVAGGKKSKNEPAPAQVPAALSTQEASALSTGQVVYDPAKPMSSTNNPIWARANKQLIKPAIPTQGVYNPYLPSKPIPVPAKPVVQPTAQEVLKKEVEKQLSQYTGPARVDAITAINEEFGVALPPNASFDAVADELIKKGTGETFKGIGNALGGPALGQAMAGIGNLIGEAIGKRYTFNGKATKRIIKNVATKVVDKIKFW